tara:strand:+ start:97 stop:468 length:372 start_codon:yes stop_codon:yes gene_type:complete
MNIKDGRRWTTEEREKITDEQFKELREKSNIIVGKITKLYEELLETDPEGFKCVDLLRDLNCKIYEPRYHEMNYELMMNYTSLLTQTAQLAKNVNHKTYEEFVGSIVTQISIASNSDLKWSND